MARSKITNRLQSDKIASLTAFRLTELVHKLSSVGKSKVPNRFTLLVWNSQVLNLISPADLFLN
jgi:hypothetical protein